ncbi:MAG: family 43 glycosylhydrolase [Anaerolineaceae bacterium]|nr:family 43 glycosylhydrolase [Anaerolineaceae bacterium]
MQKMNLSDIHIRDPFVVPVSLQRRYYMYGTMGEYTWLDHAVGFDCYVGDDLEKWAGPFPVFRPSEDFWSDRSFWAPEVYTYAGRFYMFASFKAEGVCRGTQILVADSALGPFIPLSEKPVTPSDWECLDGTLHIDEVGKPWMVFCHEWVQVGDGEICAIPLSEDLSIAVGDPIKLFSASQAAWAIELNSKGRKGYVTDGPWMHHLPNGELLILWSSHGSGGYSIGVARSTSGQLKGPWSQDKQPLYSKDGGHCMTFRDFEGNLWLSLHHPDGFPNERPKFIPLDEEKLVLH